ncbi:hypothetical protein BI084_gp04 [Gordonia phage Terapin]|uniref:Uncharacterized protein n=5 Tax=Terapinvirus terapin TaxID=2734283 RepID=A0A345MB44_9CAUD|nr:hypothetical protein BI084_gp04 [Gordonia phage Terapin]AVP43281.1 hypothetical protein PBI_DJOKOVIC_4 [Gordonia phage Djokovic]AXH67715.1 hypothetical protein SEA_BEYONCAGE_4 [Gordonia phage Beyoncage]QOC56149.1 hypothetical protein SEA_SIENNA_4 [Gordonia phage Sienna]QOC56574.1 hypothetical protein SEA_BITESIZE_4 [Gordonia phage BiteSize]QYW00807.1 hypothetical protein SEA_MADI_4 [Gordonia phage Madi]
MARRRGAWGNALGGYKRQRRVKGRFASGSGGMSPTKQNRQLYRKRKRAINRNTRKNVRSENFAAYRPSVRKGFNAIAQAHGANPRGAQLTRDIKYSSAQMKKSYRQQGRQQKRVLKASYKIAQNNVKISNAQKSIAASPHLAGTGMHNSINRKIAKRQRQNVAIARRAGIANPRPIPRTGHIGSGVMAIPGPGKR